MASARPLPEAICMRRAFFSVEDCKVTIGDDNDPDALVCDATQNTHVRLKKSSLFPLSSLTHCCCMWPPPQMCLEIPRGDTFWVVIILLHIIMSSSIADHCQTIEDFGKYISVFCKIHTPTFSTNIYLNCTFLI